ncbi:octapeptide-repeat protein T2-like [Ambystoma mexicanum]|uniref:octapeptide-repeat protein T2-like n=1 Tax=Ambystoma mexicanum TaxID=8296 RepID=UPI0037E7DD12
MDEEHRREKDREVRLESEDRERRREEKLEQEDRHRMMTGGREGTLGKGARRKNLESLKERRGAEREMREKRERELEKAERWIEIGEEEKRELAERQQQKLQLDRLARERACREEDKQTIRTAKTQVTLHRENNRFEEDRWAEPDSTNSRGRRATEERGAGLETCEGGSKYDLRDIDLSMKLNTDFTLRRLFC